MNFFRTLLLTTLIVALAACVAPFRDESHYVPVTSTDGYYLLEKGGHLALELGYTNPPTSSNDDRLHPGSYTDVIAFRFNSAGILTEPPAYFAEFSPDGMELQKLTKLKRGVSAWPEIRALFESPNRVIKQPDGGILVYHEIPKNS